MACQNKDPLPPLTEEEWLYIETAVDTVVTYTCSYVSKLGKNKDDYSRNLETIYEARLQKLRVIKAKISQLLTTEFPS